MAKAAAKPTGAYLPTEAEMRARGFEKSGVSGGYFWKSGTGPYCFWLYCYLLPKEKMVFVHQAPLRPTLATPQKKAVADAGALTKLLTEFGWVAPLPAPTT